MAYYYDPADREVKVEPDRPPEPTPEPQREPTYPDETRFTPQYERQMGEYNPSPAGGYTPEELMATGGYGGAPPPSRFTPDIPERGQPADWEREVQGRVLNTIANSQHFYNPFVNRVGLGNAGIAVLDRLNTRSVVETGQPLDLRGLLSLRPDQLNTLVGNELVGMGSPYGQRYFGGEPANVRDYLAKKYGATAPAQAQTYTAAPPPGYSAVNQPRLAGTYFPGSSGYTGQLGLPTPGRFTPGITPIAPTFTPTIPAPQPSRTPMATGSNVIVFRGSGEYNAVLEYPEVQKFIKDNNVQGQENIDRVVDSYLRSKGMTLR